VAKQIRNEPYVLCLLIHLAGKKSPESMRMAWFLRDSVFLGQTMELGSDISIVMPYHPTIWKIWKNLPSLLIRQTFGCRWSDMVPWPEMYDWLVSCEVVNLPVPFDAAGEAEVSEEQPSLF